VKIRDINFPKLLKKVNEIKGKFWIRFTSPHPKPSTRAELGAGPVPHRNKVSGAGDFSWDELIEAMAKSGKVTPYLNLPVQSGDDEILKKMNRPYTIAHYKNLVKKIRKKIPDIALSTDAIVGFPGETKKQFENTVKLFKEIKYEMAYIAKYSSRPGTTASKLKDNVSTKEKKRRWLILNKILKKTALEKNKKYVGKEVGVLIDTKKDNFYFGKTRTYKTVKLQTSDFRLQTSNLIGQFIKVKIIDALPWGLRGILV
jgi:tRNA-2-methylthio-N6-dimethylallyladenosine synthase